LRYQRPDEKTLLAVAGIDPECVDGCINGLVEKSVTTSIYRNQLISMTYEAGTKGEHGDIERPEQFRINFKVAAPVSEEDFVVDDDIFKTLWRNVIEFARTYQSSLVILEDVDLVFTARDINLYSSEPGDVLDQMDDLRPFEDVGVIRTTNSIERMEAAIKDRPGRISQCIYFGPPRKELRAPYIAQYAQGYDYSSVDIDELIRMCDGTTPAFIEGCVHRAVQIATERLEQEDPKLVLKTDDFTEAYTEMKRFGFLGSDE
jgi:hypothetical protein